MKTWFLTFLGEAWGPPFEVTAATAVAALEKWAEEVAAECGETEYSTCKVAVHEPHVNPLLGTIFVVTFHGKQFQYKLRRAT